MRYSWKICTFSSLDDLPRKLHSNYSAVRNAVIKAGRFSVFEATANNDIANTMTRLSKDKTLKFTDDGYPWTKVEPLLR